MNKKIKIKVPATVANLVCGFDVLGMAISEPYDVMEFALLPENKIIIHHTDDFNLPTEPSKNVAGIVLLEILKKINQNIGFEVTIHKNIKPGSGLGSSAASAAGAAFGANVLLGNIFTKTELVEFAKFGEELASGAKHADNIAPCIFGGITLIKSNHPLDIVALSVPDVWVVAMHPQIEIKTSDARQILKKEIKLTEVITQMSNIAGFVAGVMKNDYSLIAKSLQDVIIEPVRSMLIPEFALIKKNALALGALGGGISGSGPSIFMMCESREIAEKVSEMMQRTYQNLHIENLVYISKINKQGIELIEE